MPANPYHNRADTRQPGRIDAEVLERAREHEYRAREQHAGNQEDAPALHALAPNLGSMNLAANP